MTGDTETTEIHKALAHPVRREILAYIQKEKSGVAPIDYAKVSKRSVSFYAYHFRVLDDVGLIKLERTEPARGSVKHVFVLTDKFRKGMLDGFAGWR